MNEVLTPTLPLGEEIMQLYAIKLNSYLDYLFPGTKLRAESSERSSLTDLVEHQVAAHGYTAESPNNIGTALLAELGGQVLTHYFEDQAAYQRTTQLIEAARQQYKQAQIRLSEISKTYKDRRIAATPISNAAESIFTLRSFGGLKYKQYSQAIGLITPESFSTLDGSTISLGLRGLRRFTSTKLDIRLFDESEKPLVKLELLN